LAFINIEKHYPLINYIVFGYKYIENIHGFFYLSKLEISGHIHNNQEANLLYRYQLSYEKAKKGRSTEIECPYQIKSPTCAMMVSQVCRTW
jgi:hypothetical protein